MPGVISIHPDMSPLQLLRQIRDVMASSEPAQARLDKIVKIIAHGFSSEVCSVYLLRAGDVLELFATEGLNPSSVHLTRLSVGEGLVGEVASQAETLNLENAQKHPKFAYRPETGEEIYHAFVAVPILRGGKVIGVLVVQGRQEKSYSAEQVEVLQTVAMVLAEMTQSSKLVSLSELRRGGGQALLSQHFIGMKLSPGIVRAPAVLHRPKIDIKKVVAEDVNVEEQRLEYALMELQNSVDQLINEANLNEDEEHRDIMETYRMFTRDRGWIDQITEAIRTGLTAEAAVRKVQEQLHARMSQMQSEYIKERMQDLDDVSNRLLQHLTGTEATSAHSRLPARFVLVAQSMGPAELLDYGRKRLKGLVLEEGSATSHIVIIARAMDIPVVGGIDGATELIQAGDPVIVDGDNGEVYLRPTDEIEQMALEHIKANRRREKAYAAMRDLPARTLDGTDISINMNAGLFLDMKQVESLNVDGIGLYRTELPYMLANDFPDVKYQTKIYAKVLRQAKGKRVIFRTFDIGGDKQVPYFRTEAEENPAMGWRATRIGLDRPGILRRQLRALIMAADGGPLDLMFPFITEVAEMEAVRKLLDNELKRTQAEGRAAPSSLRVGAMIEVPSILWQLSALYKHVDFVSVGSNDLMQFLFACDRGSPHMADRYDTLSPVMLNVVRHVVREAQKEDVEVCFCGEMARKPLEAMCLIGLGIRNISVPPSSVGPVKAMIRSLDIRHFQGYTDYLCSSQEHSVRGNLEEYAKDHKVEI